MSRINVLVATISPDLKAEVIAESVAARPDMNLIERRCVAATEVDALLKSIPASPQSALVLVGHPHETNALAERWLTQRADLVVMHVEVIGDIVRIAVRAERLDPLLTALRELVERVASQGAGHVARIFPRSAASQTAAESDQASVQAPLLHASIDWIHRVLHDAVWSVSDENGDVHGLSVTRATLLQSLSAPV